MSDIAKNTFTIRYTSSEDGKVYDGQFTVKRMSIRDKAQLGVRRAQLSGGMYCVRNDKGEPTGQGIDDSTEMLNFMIAHLEIALVQKPIWFKLEEITDDDLLREIYQKVSDFEGSFKSGGRGGDQGSSSVRETDSSSQRSEAGSGNVPKVVVDEKVQASLDA